jgi:hypothetical protein
MPSVQGWVLIDDLIEGAMKNGIIIDKKTLDIIVNIHTEEKRKKRVEYSEDLLSIRAGQGHSSSTGIRPDMDIKEPPNVLYQGTSEKSVSSIKSNGLSSMGRANAFCGYSYPRDLCDFERCIKMIDAIPELKEKLYLMTDESKDWFSLISNWDTMCKLIDNNNREEAYKLLRKNN